VTEFLAVQFTVYGEARPAGSKRAFFKAGMKRAIVIEDDRKCAGWRENVAREAAKAMNGAPLLAGPLSLQVTFYRVRPASHLKKSGGLTSSAPAYPEPARVEVQVSGVRERAARYELAGEGSR
jgi:endodeoxyribonuclease RusA